MATAARRLKPKDAIAALRTRIMTPRSAVASLSRLDNTVNMLELFKHYFPVEFAPYSRVSLFDVQLLRGATLSFLEQIDRHKFPVPDFYLDELDEVWDEGERLLTYVPLWPISDEWWNGQPEDMRLVFRILLIFDGSLSNQEGEGWHAPDIFDDLPGDIAAALQKVPGTFSYELLREACKRERSPLKALASACEILHHDSMNTWVSLTSENAGYDLPSWSQENIDWLANEYQEAGRMFDEVVALDMWLTESPARIKRLIKFWQKVKVAKKERVRVQIGVPLIDVLGDEGLLDGEE